MNRMKLTLTATALALPLVATTLAGAATNLVSNGTFDANINGWATGQNQPAIISWKTGRLAVANVADTNSETNMSAQQCVANVAGGFPHTLEADIWVPPLQVQGWARLGILHYPTADCSGAPAPVIYLSPKSTLVGATETLSVKDPGDPAAKSFRLLLMSVKTPTPPGGQASSHLVLFDDVTFSQDLPQLQDPPGPVINVPLAEVPQGPFDIIIPGPLGQGPKSEPSAQPSGPSNPEPEQPQAPGNPGQPEQPKADVPAVQAESPAAAADSGTPAPPSAGSGLADDSSRPLVPLLAAALMAVAGAFATVTAAAVRRR